MIYFIEKDTGLRFERCVEYNGLAWFPVADYKDKGITEFNSIEDAEAVAMASSMEWEGVKIKIVGEEEMVEAEDGDEKPKPILIKEFFVQTKEEIKNGKGQERPKRTDGGGGDKSKAKPARKSGEPHDSDGQSREHNQTGRPKRKANDGAKENKTGGIKSHKRK